MLLEICANSVESAIAAQNGGADRVELCENIPEGGCTPSSGSVFIARKKLNIDLHVIIRPRGGDFLYTQTELEIIKADIESCKKAGAEGVVFGVLTSEGKIDKEICSRLVELAYPMKTTFHRAFDMTSDPYQSLNDIIECGFDILLTSGMQNKAIDGINILKELVVLADDKIEIMPGSGISEENILEIATKTNARSFHVSVRKKIESKMIFRNETIKMGGIQAFSEFERLITDENSVRNIRNILATIS